MAAITRHASAFTNTTGFDGNFSTPANAYSSDGQYAESTVDANPRNDEYATCWRGFDFSSIPDGSTINTVTVHMEYHVDTQWSNGTIRLSVWADVTTGQALSLGDTGNLALWTQAASSAPTSDTDWSNQMGANPTLAQLKASGFGLRVEHWQGNDSNARSTSIDDLYIVVDYTAGVTTVGGSFTANAVIKASSGTKTFTADAIIEKAQSGSFTADAVIADAPSATAYTALVESLNPDGYWPLDDASGNFRDASGNGFTATVSGTPVYGATGPTIDSEVQSAITFDGSTDDAVASSAVDDGATEFTISAWFKTTSAVSEDMVCIWYGGDGISWTLYYDGGGSLLLIGSSDGSAADIGAGGNTGGGTLDDDAWHHVVAWADASSVWHIDVDGGTFTNFAGPHSWNGPSTAPLTIGGDNSAGFWAGNLAHVAYWKSDIGADARTSLYTGTAGAVSGSFTADAVIWSSDADYWDNFTNRVLTDDTFGTSLDGTSWLQGFYGGFQVNGPNGPRLTRVWPGGGGGIFGSNVPTFDHAVVKNTRVRALVSWDRDPTSASAWSFWFGLGARDWNSGDDRYNAMFMWSTTGEVRTRVERRDSSSWTWSVVAAADAGTWTDLTAEKWWCEFEVTNDGELKTRMWEDGGSIPSSPSNSGTDTSPITTAGKTDTRMGIESGEATDATITIWQWEVWDLGTRSFTADAVIKASSGTKTFTADAIIEAPQSGSLTADAVIIDAYDELIIGESGLQAYLPMWETSGTTIEDIVGTYDGTPNGGYT
ncbi:MAG TPA: LamG-like jellyroll fold domain-containing protein, partial [Actinomycetes bacterium]|nr:LamG-like jellyroll fold domain-containing protein [Actinomycetes bacterium]